MVNKLIYIILLISNTVNVFSQNKVPNCGVDYWIGEVNKNSERLGFYIEPEIFEQDFGNNGRFEFSGVSIDPYQFKVNYLMKSTKKGCYICDISAANYATLKVDDDFATLMHGFSTTTSTSHMLIKLTGNSLLRIYYAQKIGDHYLKFKNLRKLNNIVVNKSQTIFSGSRPDYIDGDKLPQWESNKSKCLKLQVVYDWEKQNKDGEWVNISGKNSNFWCRPPILYNKGDTDITYNYRRIAIYSQNRNDETFEYSDTTAYAKVIVKPLREPALIANRGFCEDDNTISLKFVGCLPECSPLEEYNIVINDGTKNITFSNVKTDTYLKLNSGSSYSITYKITEISSSDGKHSIKYSQGKEPCIKIVKRSNIKTNTLHKIE